MWKQKVFQTSILLLMPLSLMLLFAVLGVKPRAFHILGKSPLLPPAADDVKNFFRGKADVTWLQGAREGPKRQH